MRMRSEEVGAHDPDWGSFVNNLHVTGEAKRRGIGAALLRNAGTTVMETHGGALVRSCRSVWDRAEHLAAGAERG